MGFHLTLEAMDIFNLPGAFWKLIQELRGSRLVRSGCIPFCVGVSVKPEMSPVLTMTKTAQGEQIYGLTGSRWDAHAVGLPCRHMQLTERIL